MRHPDKNDAETSAESPEPAAVALGGKRIGLLDVVVNVVFWPSLLASALVIGLVAFGLFPILFFVDPRRRVGTWLACAWCWCCLAPLRALRLWRVEFKGRENVPPGFCGVIAPNHQSQFDILVLHSSMIRAKWVSKSSVFLIPFIGWSMWTLGYVSLRRKEQKSIREMTRTCAKALDTGVPLVIFPEGTRSRDGKLQRFKNGAFLIAKLAKSPVYPVAVSGTYGALPPGRTFLRAGVRIVVTYLPPIAAEDLETKGTSEVSDQCHAAIASALGVTGE